MNNTKKYGRPHGGFYYICQHCGAALDPGEKCDCMEQGRKQDFRAWRHEAMSKKRTIGRMELRPISKSGHGHCCNN